MIIFHEGLPRSGKSYEACVYHLLPAVKEGRPVLTNIEGINCEKVASITGVPVRIVEQLITCIYHPEIEDVHARVEAQKQSFLECVQKDSLVIIDEIQNLFPSGREKLSSDWTRFITEHGHDGLDILIMGQDRRDCHNLWRRRIQRVITFTKQTAVGRDNNYTWVAYEATKPEVYKKINSGSRAYEKQYFGIYKSHTDGTKNKAAYSDDRINIFKTAGFKWGVPIFIGVLYFAIDFLGSFFNPEVAQESQPVQVEAKPVHVVQHQSPAVENRPSPSPKPEEKPEYVPIDLFDKMANKYRPRLSAYIRNENRFMALVDLYDSSYHIHDSYSVEALEAMGWSVAHSPAGLIVKKQDREYLVRPWPVDKPGRVDRDTIASHRPR